VNPSGLVPCVELLRLRVGNGAHRRPDSLRESREQRPALISPGARERLRAMRATTSVRMFANVRPAIHERGGGSSSTISPAPGRSSRPASAPPAGTAAPLSRSGSEPPPRRPRVRRHGASAPHRCAGSRRASRCTPACRAAARRLRFTSRSRSIRLPPRRRWWGSPGRRRRATACARPDPPTRRAGLEARGGAGAACAPSGVAVANRRAASSTDAHSTVERRILIESPSEQTSRDAGRFRRAGRRPQGAAAAPPVSFPSA